MNISKVANDKHLEEGNLSDDEFAVDINFNKNTFELKITLNTDYRIYFTSNTSLGNILGFDSTITSDKVNTFSNEINITDVNTFYLCCSVIQRVYENGLRTNILYPILISHFPGENNSYTLSPTDY